VERSLVTGKRRNTNTSIPSRLHALTIAGPVVLLVVVLVLLVLLGNRRRFLQRMRFFSKRVINPVVLKFAGSPHSTFAVIRHVGRRSGKAYETPLLVAPIEDGFVIELTYGLAVDWYRNVVAAGECTLLWHGREHVCDEFEPLDAEIALPAFPLALRLPLRIFGAQHFVRMKSRLVAPGGENR